MEKLKEYSWEEVEKHAGREGSLWTVVDGLVYDITNFRESHPGGEIINLAGGRDGTSLVESYHPIYSTAKVREVLKKYLIGKVVSSATVHDKASKGSGKEETSDEQDRFFQEVQKRVFNHLYNNKLDYHHWEWFGLIEISFIFLFLIIGHYLKIFYGSYFGAIIVGIASARAGFLMHSANHAGLSKSKLVNKWGGRIMTIIGSSHVVWQYEHQVAHHLAPNVVGKDNDCSIGDPYIRFHPDLKHHWWLKYQHITTFILMSMGFLKWYVSDLFNFFFCRVGSVTFNPTREDWKFLVFFKVLWFMIHLAIPYYIHRDLLLVLTLVYVYAAVGAYYLENIFIVNHIQEGLLSPSNDLHWAVHQVYTSANWSSASHFWNFFSGGLNHQIEHHLFPSMSHYLYPHISPIVKQTCEEFSIPYRNYSNFASAWFSMCSYLKKLGASQSLSPY